MPVYQPRCQPHLTATRQASDNPSSDTPADSAGIHLTVYSVGTVLGLVQSQATTPHREIAAIRALVRDAG